MLEAREIGCGGGAVSACNLGSARTERAFSQNSASSLAFAKRSSTVSRFKFVITTFVPVSKILRFQKQSMCKHGLCAKIRTFAMNIAERLGIRIRWMRQTRGVSQDQLAVRAGISRCHLSRIENGEFKVRLDTIEAICRGLLVHPCELFDTVRIEDMG